MKKMPFDGEPKRKGFMEGDSEHLSKRFMSGEDSKHKIEFMKGSVKPISSFYGDPVGVVKPYVKEHELVGVSHFPRPPKRHRIVQSLRRNADRKIITEKVLKAYLAGDYGPLKMIMKGIYVRHVMEYKKGLKKGSKLTVAGERICRRKALSDFYDILNRYGRCDFQHFDYLATLGWMDEKTTEDEYRKSIYPKWQQVKTALTRKRSKRKKPVRVFYINTPEELKKALRKDLMNEFRSRYPYKKSKRLTNRILKRFFAGDVDTYKFVGHKYDYDLMVRDFSRYPPEVLSEYESSIHWLKRYEAYAQDYRRKFGSSVLQQLKRYHGSVISDNLSFDLHDAFKSGLSVDDMVNYAHQISDLVTYFHLNAPGKSPAVIRRKSMAKHLELEANRFGSSFVNVFDRDVVKSPRFFMEEFPLEVVKDMGYDEMRKFALMKNVMGKVITKYAQKGKMFDIRWKHQGNRWFRLHQGDLADITYHIWFSPKKKINLPEPYRGELIARLHEGLDERFIGDGGKYLIERFEASKEHFHFFVSTSSMASPREVVNELKNRMKDILKNDGGRPYKLELQKGFGAVAGSSSTVMQLEKYLNEHLDKEVSKGALSEADGKLLYERSRRARTKAKDLEISAGVGEPRKAVTSRYDEFERSIHMKIKRDILADQKRRGDRANYCEECLHHTYYPADLQLHHVLSVSEARNHKVPLSGYQNRKNTVLLCKHCHADKHVIHPGKDKWSRGDVLCYGDYPVDSATGDYDPIGKTTSPKHNSKKKKGKKKSKKRR